MRRGTTPTHTFTTDIDLSGAQLNSDDAFAGTMRIMPVRFSTANTVEGEIKIKLKYSSTTDWRETTVYKNGAKTSASNPLTWSANSTLLFMYFAYPSSKWEYIETYNLPTASATVLGGVKIDDTTITASNGVISAASQLPSVSASDNDKVLTVVSGAWAAATPSGGGGVSVTTTTVTIAASNWSNKTCTKSVTGVTASNTVLVSYAPASKTAYTSADVYCSAQGAGTLTFGCTTTPTASITVNVMIIDS